MFSGHTWRLYLQSFLPQTPVWPHSSDNNRSSYLLTFLFVCLLFTGRRSHNVLVSIFPNASGHYWTVGYCSMCRKKWGLTDCVETGNVWQRPTSRQCHTSLIPACWPNLTAVYNVYTLQTKLLLIGWRHTAHRSIRNQTNLVTSESNSSYHIVVQHRTRIAP